jgi:hypothetical protein
MEREAELLMTAFEIGCELPDIVKLVPHKVAERMNDVESILRPQWQAATPPVEILRYAPTHFAKSAVPEARTPWNTNKTIYTYLESARSDKALQPMSLVTHVCDIGGEGRLHGVNYLSGRPALVLFEREQLVRMNQPLPVVQSWFLAKMRDLLTELKKNFSVVLVDCPPGFSLSAEAALTDADKILIPTIPTALSVQGLIGYQAYLDLLEIPSIRARSGILKTMVRNTTQNAYWEGEIDKLAAQWKIFGNKLTFAAAWTAAMNRENGHKPYETTYGGVAGELESVRDEFMDWL